MIDRQQLQAFHPFVRLNRLLADVPAGRFGEHGYEQIILSLGEPQNSAPDLLAEALAEAATGWSRYPPPRGTPDYLAACREWLERRYGLQPGLVEPARHLLALPGSKEGLFFAVLTAVLAAGRGEPPPCVLLPEPFYHVYAGAALAAGAEPVFVPATAATGHQPDYAGVDESVLARTALAILCSPANPQGSVADLDRLRGLISLARRHGFTVLFDECYAEIYTRAPPPGALQAAAEMGGSLDNLLAFHSLSKRSSAAGLRCGFVVGDAARIDALDAALRVGGAGVPLPSLAAGARLWRDETHVERNRDFYRENFAVAERILGGRFGQTTPAGGFFLWLDVGDGEEAARALWAQGGIKVLPGAYMCHQTGTGKNPGRPYIRVALVYPSEVIEGALSRIANIL